MASAKRKSHVVLDDSDDEYTPDSHSDNEGEKRPRKSVKPTTPPQKKVVSRSAQPALPTPQSHSTTKPTLQVSPLSPSPQVSNQPSARPSAATSLPSPDTTPMKPSELYKVPEVADRYVPKVSTLDQIDYVNPRVFCIEPAYWKKWTPGNYRAFAEHLRMQFNPIPFAQASGRPVEEIRQIFNCLLVNPLYNAEIACKRGEEGMAEVFEFYKKHSAVTRSWGMKTEGEKSREQLPRGKLHGIKPRSVQIVLTDGSKKQLAVPELSEADKKYLKATLSAADVKTLVHGGRCS